MFCIALRRGEVYRGELCLVGVRQARLGEFRWVAFWLGRCGGFGCVWVSYGRAGSVWLLRFVVVW